MKNLSVLAGFAILAAIGLSFTGCPDVSPEQPKKGPQSVSGVVLGGDSNTPLTGANVVLLKDGEPAEGFAAQTTSFAGTFSFENVPDDEGYSVRVTAPMGYEDDVSQSFAVSNAAVSVPAIILATTDFAALQEALTAADEVKIGIEENDSTRTGVVMGKKFAPSSAFSALNDVIASASTVKNSTSSRQADIDAAASALISAIRTFTGLIKTGKGLVFDRESLAELIEIATANNGTVTRTVVGAAGVIWVDAGKKSDLVAKISAAQAKVADAAAAQDDINTAGLDLYKANRAFNAAKKADATNSDAATYNDAGTLQTFKTILATVHYLEDFERRANPETIVVIDNTYIAYPIEISEGYHIKIVADTSLKTVSRATGFTGTFFDVNDELILDGSSATLTFDGRSIAGSKSLVTVNSEATLTVNTGAILTKNSADTGGGVLVQGGTFNLDGGAIGKKDAVSENGGNAANYGGGVYVNVGHFNITAGDVAGNAVGGGRRGAGVYLSGASTLTMSGGNISYNCANGENSWAGGLAGGVYVGADSVFTMSGGQVSHNRAHTRAGGATYGYGGGVWVVGGTFTLEGSAVMDGNTITNNTSGYARVFGGGIAVTDGGSLILRGDAVISNSTLPPSGGDRNGGGIYASGSSSVVMSGNASISGNTALIGGGVIIYKPATFAKTGGTITGDTNNTHSEGETSNTAINGATGYGHAIYYSGSPSKYSDATLEADDDWSAGL
jgi:hypothetical protein